MHRVAIHTLGCKVNRADSQLVEEGLNPRRFAVVPFEEEADLYLINTCSVTSAADREARAIARETKRRSPRARIVMTGCYASTRSDELRAMPEVDLVVGNDAKERMGEIFSALLPPDDSATSAGSGAIIRRRDRKRAVVKIQEGCAAYCAFCIIPYSRGSSNRSLPAEAVLERLRVLAGAGHHEAILTGVYVGGYGRDLAPSLRLVDLLRRIADAELGLRIRLSSIQPTEVDNALLDLLAGSRTFCRHLHLPFQSGDDEVLRRMNRPYTGRWYGALVEKIAARIPGVCLGADVLVGFPGETDDAFGASRGLCEALPLSYLHVFPYSPRPGTAAARLGSGASPDVLKARGRALRAIGDAKSAAFYAAQVGTRVEVITEERPAPIGLRKGTSDNYLNVVYPALADAGGIARVRIQSVEGREAYGAPVTPS